MEENYLKFPTWFPVEILILQYIMASVKRVKYLKI